MKNIGDAVPSPGLVPRGEATGVDGRLQAAGPAVVTDGRDEGERLSPADREVVQGYLADPRFPAAAKPLMERVMAAPDASSVRLNIPEKRALSNLLSAMYGAGVPASLAPLLAPRLTDDAPLSHLEFKPNPAPAAAPAVGHDGMGPIALFDDPYATAPMETKPAVHEQPPAAPARGFFAAPLHTLKRMENSVLALAAKDDPALTYEPLVDKINELGPAMKSLTDEQLKAKKDEFKQRLEAGEKQDSVLPEAFAAVREAASRARGWRPYDVQMLGGIVMSKNMIAEMGTGEGKTLAAVAPVYLNALMGKGAHVVTVNETLAQRDAESNAPIYQALGLSVGVVLNDMTPEQKRAGYNADVTYLTNSTIGFDYLRDNMAKKPEDVVQREPYFALVDEVDEILIDEARTPLIIAQSTDPSTDLYSRFAGIVDKLKEGDDYEVDYKKRTVSLTDAGTAKVDKQLGMSIWDSADPKSIDDAVRKAQADGKPVTIGFASRDEAFPYMAQLKADKRPYVESHTAFGHPANVIGITYPEAAPAQKARPVQEDAVLLKSADFDHMDMISYLTAALKAKSLFERDRDYVVQETPAWADKRDNARLNVFVGKMDAPQLAALQQEAGSRTSAALSQLENTGAAPSGPLQQWWDLQNPKPSHIPESVLQAQYDADGKNIVLDRINKLPAADKAALEAETRKILGNDPQAKVNIVDEFTGRVLPGRRFSEGLHQALEAKEGVEVQPETQTMASITYPNLFRLYPHLCGMSGTAKSEEEELNLLYNLPVGVVPPNKPSRRKDEADEVYMTAAEKYRAVIDEIRKAQDEGYAVLVGTKSIEINGIVARLAKKRGLEFQLLNADSVKNNTAAENAIIAAAGESGTVTIATNMAGRGVDIKPSKYNFAVLTRTAADQLTDAALEARSNALEAQFAKQPADRQAALSQLIDAEVAADFTRQQRNAVGAALPASVNEKVAKDAGDVNVVGMEAFRQALAKGREAAIDAALAQMSPKDRDALAGPQASAQTVRNVRGLVLTRELGLDPTISYLEGRRGVGITFDKLKPDDSPDKVFEQVDKMATRLAQQGLPVVCAEPGVRAQDLAPGQVTLIYPGASQRPPQPAVPAAVPPPVPEFAQGGAVQPGTLVEAAKYPGMGLYVIGTERHESLRIDRQLQGRSGRQGDVGRSKFFMSMEDDLMRYFGGEAMAKKVQKLGLKDGESLSHPALSKLIREAQKSVEARDFDQRSNAAKYDGVCNAQREAVYKERKEILGSRDADGKIVEGTDLTPDVRDWADDRLDTIASEFKGHHDKISADDAVALTEQVREKFGLKVEPDASRGLKALVDDIRAKMHEAYDARAKELGRVGLRDLYLSNVDDLWHYELDNLASLQQGIGWVQMAQQKPEVEFALQATEMYDKMVQDAQDGVLDNVFKPATVSAPQQSPSGAAPGPEIYRQLR